MLVVVGRIVLRSSKGKAKMGPLTSTNNYKTFMKTSYKELKTSLKLEVSGRISARANRVDVKDSLMVPLPSEGIGQ